MPVETAWNRIVRPGRRSDAEGGTILLMSDLWADKRAERRAAAQPLAARLRPTTLEQFTGQQHFLGPEQLLTRMLAADRLTSVLFWGPPGTGKTYVGLLVMRVQELSIGIPANRYSESGRLETRKIPISSHSRARIKI